MEGDASIMARLVEDRLGLDDSQAPTGAGTLVPKAKKKSDTRPTKESMQRFDVAFSGENQSSDDVIQHFMTASSTQPGHGTIRTEESMQRTVELLPDGIRDTYSITSFEDSDSFLDACNAFRIQESLEELDRSDARLLKDLHKLCHRVVQSIEDGTFEKSESDQRSRSRSRSRSRRKSDNRLSKEIRKLRKSRHGKSRSDSVSSGEDIRKRIPRKIKEAGITLVEPNSLANAKTFDKFIRGLKNSDFPIQDFDSFYPEYVGEGLPTEVKNDKRNQRYKQSAKKPIAFFETVTCLWSTHTLNGKISFEGIVAHLLLLFQMIANHGTAFTCRYERLLYSKIADKCRFTTFDSYDSFLKSIDDTVFKQAEKMTSVNLQSDNSTNDNSGSPSGSKSGGKSGGKAGKYGSPSQTGNPRQITRAEPKSGPSPKGGGKKSAPQSSNDASRRHICLFHDPRNGKSCRFGDSCRDIHLNTNLESDLRRFQGAAEASNRNRTRGG